MINKILILIVMTSVGGCSPQYTRFTQKLRDAEKLSGQDLKNIQYYICPRLLIERSVSSSERKINEGKLIRKSGEWVHQVLIPKWTPGLVVNSTDKSVDVSFKKGTKITFGVDKNNIYYRTTYYHTDLETYYHDHPNDDWYARNYYKKTWYDGEIYNIVYEESEDCEDYKGKIPRLWIDSESFKKLKKERKILEGLTLPQD